MNVEIVNTSIFTDDFIKKGIDRLMNSPILDFICSMPDDKWEKFQREFFDYYYNSFKEYNGEIGFKIANESNGDFKFKYEQSEFGRLTENMIDRLQKANEKTLAKANEIKEVEVNEFKKTEDMKK